MSTLLPALLVFLGARAQDANTSRPQLPTRPLDYDESEVLVPTSRAGGLAGTLTHPRGTGAVPAVILVQGGSPFDRDGTFAGHKPLLVLSDALTRAGFATLRLDDRGTGGSRGAKFSLTLEELARDLEECVSFLREQDGIRADRIGLLGHSGGALLSALVAARDPELAFAVLLGCPALPLPALIAAQLAADGDGSAEIGTLLGTAAADLAREDALASGLVERVQARWQELVATLPEDSRPGAEAFVASMSRKLPFLLGNPYLRAAYCFEPDPVLRRIRCPVLALWGEYDQGRKLANASAVEMVRCLAAGECSDFQVAQVPRTNHFLQTCRTGAMDEFARIEETISPAVLRLVVEWSSNRSEAGGRPER